MLKIHKFLLSSAQEKAVFLRALYLLLYYRISLKFRSLQRLLSDVNRKCADYTVISHSAISVQKIARLTAAASRCVPYSTCFSKALAGLVIYSESGYPARLHIGVKKDQKEGFAAHAWLTYSEEIVLCNLPGMEEYREIPLEKLEMFQ